MRKKKSLGQHFLTNPEIAKKIVSFLENGHLCVEIGAGEGILTEELIKKFGKVLIIEKDEDLIPILKERFQSFVEIKNSDILIVGDKIFSNLDEFFVASNLPYNISSPITFLLLRHYNKIPQMVLMYQREVAHKISKQVSIMSCLTYPYYSVKEVMRLKPGAFSPPPKVESSVLFFNKKDEIPDIDFNKYLSFLKVVFDGKRKVLFKRLRGYLPEDSLREIYDKLKIDLKARIDSFSCEKVLNLFLEIRNKL